jgi:glycosyltransferase involved in cell wall biosynthesis
MDLSVIIPSRNSGGVNFCSKTIQDVLDKSEMDTEVIVCVEEKWPSPLIKDKRVTYIHPAVPRGLRGAVNAGVAMARGKYIMKADDHILMGQGFDKILIENHLEDNWVQIPRRYALDAENWKIDERTDDKYPIDYMYVDFPRKGKAHDDGMHGVPWKEMRERNSHSNYDIDDTPTMQGSCYFMTKNHFDNFLHGLDQTNYGHFAQESQEINFKTWLGGGRCVVNKKTYYAHLHKGSRYGRMYKLDDPDHVKGAEWSAEHWLNNREPGMIYKFEWLINEKFPGMPSWPLDWQEQIRQMGWIK